MGEDAVVEGLGDLLEEGQGEAVEGLVLGLRGANAQQVVNGVRAKIREITPSLPKGVSVQVFYDRGNLVERAVATVTKALFEAIVLVVILLVLFLGNLRAALTVALALPLAACAGDEGEAPAAPRASSEVREIPAETPASSRRVGLLRLPHRIPRRRRQPGPPHERDDRRHPHGLLELLGHAFLAPGDEAVMGSCSFIVYKLVSLLFGAKPVEVPSVIGTPTHELAPGRAWFKIDGKEYSLEPTQDGDSLFFVFKDRTAPKETYGGGRFLEGAEGVRRRGGAPVDHADVGEWRHRIALLPAARRRVLLL